LPCRLGDVTGYALKFFKKTTAVTVPTSAVCLHRAPNSKSPHPKLAPVAAPLAAAPLPLTDVRAQLRTCPRALTGSHAHA
jgi:hypothetical protein